MKKLLGILVLGLLLSGNAFAGASTGCIQGDCVNGYGTYVWSSGNKYIGQHKAARTKDTDIMSVLL